MGLLRSISQLLFLAAIGLFLFDAANEWIMAARFKIGTVEEWWTYVSRHSFNATQAFVQSILPPGVWNTFAHLPAPAALCLMAAFFYAIFRLLFLLRGKNKNTYK